MGRLLSGPVVQKCGGEIHEGCACASQEDEPHVQRLIGAVGVQRVPGEYDTAEQRKLIEEGIRDKDIGKIKSVESSAYTLANDSQTIDMILILLNQGWVGPRDESAIYDIWKSRGKGVVALASKYAYVWNMCLSRHVDMIWSIPDLQPVKTEFKQAVAGRARTYLDANRRTVETELKRYGLNDMGATPSPEQAREREDLMTASIAVNKAKNAVKALETMLVGYTHVVNPPGGGRDHPVGRPESARTERCAAQFDPTAPPQAGNVSAHDLSCRWADESAALPSWDEVKKNYNRAHGVVNHYTRRYPALVALREDTVLNDVSRTAVSSEEPAGRLMAMQLVREALNDTKGNIDKTYGLVNDAKGDFPLELQPIHEQFFLSDPAWRDPFRQMVARQAVREHGNVEFWNTIGVSAIGMALFVVAELASGGLATFFFAAAAAGGIAQAAASWDKYFTLKAAEGTNMSEETALMSRDQVSDQFLTAALDTVMAFVDAYTAAKGGAKALAKAGEAEAKFAGIAGKEAHALAEEMKAARVEVAAGHEVRATERGIERCSPEPCPLIGEFWENSLTRHPQVGERLEGDARRARTDPVWAARDAASADQALQNLTEQELDLWAASLPNVATSEHPKFTAMKRLPEKRLDIANNAVSPEKMEFIEKNIAEMKKDGRLRADYTYSPPAIPGAVLPLEAAQRAQEVIGLKISGNDAIASCWQKAVDATLQDRGPLTAANYPEHYKSAAGRFWRLMGKQEHASAKAFFVERGFTVNGERAAYLEVEGVHRQEVALGLDHMSPKATGDNYRYALDGDRIQFLFQADNTKLSHIETKDPSLRRP
ncbi:hypothetical protein [Planotetraspora kaengkrachanensis]|uniref:hypothetical protein n=1 Tax=Planotetraspora kaengkrachanensis TaxID=575193 RepID=UPI0019435BA9|nr:hypothetical protein [Planotetraspora kaengkrachanensis]